MMMSLSLFFSYLFCISFFIFPSIPTLSAQLTNISSFSSSNSPWKPSQNQILLSKNSTFAAGFQPLNKSSSIYNFAIWYHGLEPLTIVWSVSTPVSSASSLLITSSGELFLNDTSGRNLWTSSDGTKAVGSTNSTSLVLGEDGKLSYGNWSSFMFPTDTILPSQPINGTNLVSRNGKFSFLKAEKLAFNGSSVYWSSNAFLLLDDQGKVTRDGTNTNFITSDYQEVKTRRLTLDDDGNLRTYSYDNSSSSWTVTWMAVQEICTIYGTCGPNFICENKGFNFNTSCICPAGFKRVAGRGAGGEDTCERNIPLSDLASTKYLQMDYVNYSGGSNHNLFVTVRNFADCQANCSANRDCIGFGFMLDGTVYCSLQLKELLYGYWSPGTQSTMFVRVDAKETNVSNYTGMTSLLQTTCPVNISLPLPPEESKTTVRNIAIICTLFLAEFISGVMFFCAFLRKYIKYRDMARTLGLELLPAGGPKRFTYSELKAATNDFTDQVGKGGFGNVYKGELPDRRIVAVKVLKNVAGGDSEFWAEVTSISRMHHLNLVRLWGFCAEKGQRILVYEYVPNGSLDKYLFRRGKITSGESESQPSEGDEKPILDWNIRYRIALGVARAIAYLHEECLEWVLHCDIKPENILLGDDFCPKISDFGLAKLRKKEDLVSMSRMRGTRGYMAPEWVKMDAITPKADVYSFGMVLLEMVSGIRNMEVQGSEMDSEDWYFPRWAFDKVFKEMNVDDILDSHIRHCYDDRAHFDMVNRMVKTAMWCLQDRPDMRPSMGKVAKMLEGTVEITEPNKPTIFFLDD